MELEPTRGSVDPGGSPPAWRYGAPGKGKRMLKPEELKAIEERLMKDRERAREALRDFDRDRESSLREETGELTVYRQHPADIGTEAMEQEKQFLLASAEGRLLYEIDEALRRLYAEPEQFGTCQRCGRPIGMERLDVVPQATLCAACQIASEAAPDST
jgi:DnaK suppressor protein